MKCEECKQENKGWFVLLKKGRYSGYNICIKCLKKILEAEG